MTETRDHQPERLARGEADIFMAAHNLPEPTHEVILANGGTASVLLTLPFVDDFSLAVMKRLSEDQSFDSRIVTEILSYTMLADDPVFTLYNALVIADHFNKKGLRHALPAKQFVSAVAGLSHHNGDKGSESMHRLCDPSEIAGAAAAVQFIGTMDRDGMVKLSLLKHEDSSNRFELTVASKYLDRLLRANPEHFEAICNFLLSHPVTATKKSVQPLVEHLQTKYSPAMISGVL
jgi:hypothetical protein